VITADWPAFCDEKFSQQMAQRRTIQSGNLR
jgi:hypothetical protein